MCEEKFFWESSSFFMLNQLPQTDTRKNAKKSHLPAFPIVAPQEDMDIFFLQPLCSTRHSLLPTFYVASYCVIQNQTHFYPFTFLLLVLIFQSPLVNSFLHRIFYFIHCRFKTAQICDRYVKEKRSI